MTSSRRRVLVVGAGGHARVCIEALLDHNGTDVIGCVSRDGTGLPDLGVPMLGTDADLDALMSTTLATHVFVAVGDNAARLAVIERCVAAGHSLTSAVSRFAMVSRTAQLGEGVALLPGAVVNAATRVERGAIINTNASVDHDGVVGSCAHVAPGVAIAGDVIIGALTLVGVGARVLPGLIVGEGAIVGGGAVVTRNVQSGATVVGVPATV